MITKILFWIFVAILALGWRELRKEERAKRRPEDKGRYWAKRRKYYQIAAPIPTRREDSYEASQQRFDWK